MNWFDSIKTPKIKEKPSEKVVKVPEGFWVKCSSCGEILQAKILKENLQVCPECSFHFRVSAWERIAQLTGDGNFEETNAELCSTDPLEFSDTKPYALRLQTAASTTHQWDAIITGCGVLGGVAGDPKSGVRAMLGAFEFKFMGGSMGIVVGEKITRLFEDAIESELPAVLVSMSGGARMQEGILSLMQMAKTSALIEKMREKKLPYISILTDPTTGGVAASFSMLGDVIVAEPGALIGFAGPRVIEQTMRQALPAGFQRSEFVMKHGFVDSIIPRKDLAQTVAKILSMLLHKRASSSDSSQKTWAKTKKTK